MGKLILLSYVFLCSALVVSFGTYDRLALLYVACAYFLVIAAAWRFHKGTSASGKSIEKPLVGAVLLSAGFWLVGPVSTIPHPAWYENLSKGVAVMALVGVSMGYLLRSRRPRTALVIWLTLGILPVILWFLVPKALPKPPVDVYHFNQAASAHVIDGINPYSVILGTPLYFKKPAAYTYPPANLYPFALSYVISHDIRYGQAALMTASAFLLWLVALRIGSNVSVLITLLFLYHPRAIFVLGYSWTETILIFPFALFIFLSVYKLLPSLAAIVYGYFISLKPYLAFLSLPWLIIERRPRYLLLGILGVIAPIIPFFASDYLGTVYGGFLFVLQNVPFRADSLSLSSLIVDICKECTVSWSSLSLPIGAMAAFLTTWLFWRKRCLASYLYAVVITMLSIFLLGSLAFGGYYYLISVMLLFLIAVAAQEEGKVWKIH